MKKNIVLLMAILCHQLSFGQAAMNNSINRQPVGRNQMPLLPPHAAAHTGSRSTNAVQINYAASEDTIGSVANSTIRYYQWDINSRFVNDTSHNYSLRWAYQAIDTIIDYQTSQSFSFPTSSYMLDSIVIPIHHVNTSGQNDTIIIAEYSRISGTAPIWNAQGALVETPLHADTFIVNSSVSPNGFTNATVRPHLTIPYRINIGIGIYFSGPTTDSFSVIANYQDKCAGNCIASPSIVGENSFFDAILFNAGDTTNYSGPQSNINSNTYSDCNGNGAKDIGTCEYFYLQNFDISVFLSGNFIPSAPQIPGSDFTANAVTIIPGASINFIDQSSHSPTSWLWSFPGGTPSTSTLQNPTIVYNTAGAYDVSLISTNAVGSDTMIKTRFINVGQIAFSCDTITNVVSTDSLKLYTTTSGYLAGQNAFGDFAKADYFVNTNVGVPITSAFYLFGFAKASSGTSTFMAKIWDNDGPNGSPGTVLDSQTISYSSVVADVANSQFTPVQFIHNPMPSGNYYVGISFGYNADDTIGLVTDLINQHATNTGWEQQSSGWFSYADNTNSYGVNLSHYIAVAQCVPINCSGFAVSISTTSPSCASSNGAVFATATGGTVPYTYQWSNSATTDSINNLSTGNYTVTITDNVGCMLHQTVTVAATPCDSIWPGDADNNGVADASDVVQISIEYLSSGPVRNNASSAWVGQPGTDWQAVTYGINDKHADSDGNGVIDVNDTLAVSLNYGLTHQKAASIPRATDPVISLIPINDTIYANQDVHIKIMLGTASNPVDSLSALAFNMDLDPTIFDVAVGQLTFGNSWLGTLGTNAFSFRKLLPFQNKIDLVLARKDHQNASGYGQIGEIVLKTNAHLPNGAVASTLTISPTIIKGITASGIAKTYNTQTTTLTIKDTSVTGINNIAFDQSISIYPNPSNGHFVLTINQPSHLLNMELLNIQGQILHTEQVKDAPTAFKKEFNLSDLAKGIYLLKVSSENSVAAKRLVVQ